MERPRVVGRGVILLPRSYLESLILRAHASRPNDGEPSARLVGQGPSSTVPRPLKSDEGRPRRLSRGRRGGCVRPG